MRKIVLAALLAAGAGASVAGAAARDPAVPRKFQLLHPCPATGLASGACRGWVRDHVVPLCAGGADSVGNMQWQRRAASLVKDRAERAECRALRRIADKSDPWAGIVPVVPAETPFQVTVDPNKASADELADAPAVRAALAKLPANRDWQTIEIDKAEPNAYRLTLNYRADALVTGAEAAMHAKFVVQVLLGALVAAGRHPADERVAVMVSAMRPETGVTGKQLVRWYGNASYDYNSDSIGYDACTGNVLAGC